MKKDLTTVFEKTLAPRYSNSELFRSDIVLRYIKPRLDLFRKPLPPIKLEKVFHKSNYPRERRFIPLRRHYAVDMSSFWEYREGSKKWVADQCEITTWLCDNVNLFGSIMALSGADVIPEEEQKKIVTEYVVPYCAMLAKVWEVGFLPLAQVVVIAMGQRDKTRLQGALNACGQKRFPNKHYEQLKRMDDLFYLDLEEGESEVHDDELPDGAIDDRHLNSITKMKAAISVLMKALVRYTGDLQFNNINFQFWDDMCDDATIRTTLEQWYEVPLAEAGYERLGYFRYCCHMGLPTSYPTDLFKRITKTTTETKKHFDYFYKEVAKRLDEEDVTKMITYLELMQEEAATFSRNGSAKVSQSQDADDDLSCEPLTESAYYKITQFFDEIPLHNPDPQHAKAKGLFGKVLQAKRLLNKERVDSDDDLGTVSSPHNAGVRSDPLVTDTLLKMFKDQNVDSERAQKLANQLVRSGHWVDNPIPSSPPPSPMRNDNEASVIVGSASTATFASERTSVPIPTPKKPPMKRQKKGTKGRKQKDCTVDTVAPDDIGFFCGKCLLLFTSSIHTVQKKAAERGFGDDALETIKLTESRLVDLTWADAPSWLKRLTAYTKMRNHCMVAHNMVDNVRYLPGEGRFGVLEQVDPKETSIFPLYRIGADDDKKMPAKKRAPPS